MLTHIEQHETTNLSATNPIETKLVELWEQVLRRHPIGIRDNFFDLGGCSLSAVQLCRSIENVFHKRLEIGALFEAPTIEQLAGILASDEIAEQTVSIVALQPNGSRPPFFCICLFGGAGPVYLPLTQHLGDDQPFYGLLPSESLVNQLSTPYCLTEIARHVADAIQLKQPDGPYFLGGFCADGVLAYETARLLVERGKPVSFLALFEAQTRENQKEFRRIRYQLYSIVERFSVSRLGRHFGRLRSLGISGSGAYLAKRMREVTRDLNAILWQTRINWKRGRQKGRLDNILEALFVAERVYDPPRYDGNVVLFRAVEYREVANTNNRCGGWDKVVDGLLTVHEIPGDHLGILDEPNVRVLAEKLGGSLQAAQNTIDKIGSSHVNGQ